MPKRFGRLVTLVRSTGDIACKHYDIDIEFRRASGQRVLRSKDHFQMKISIDREPHGDWHAPGGLPSLLP